MAWGKKKRSKRSETEKLAYNLARVKKGLSNPNSKVSESYNNGLKSVDARKEKKPLI